MVKVHVFLSILIGMLLNCSLAFAAESGTLSISAYAPEMHSLQISNNDTFISDKLGLESIIDVALAKITLNSNAEHGFKIKIESSQSGHLVRSGQTIESAPSSEKILYTLSFDSSSDEASYPEVTNVSLATPIELAFDPSSDGLTSGLTYDLSLRTPEKLLETGSYSDTLTLVIADI